MGICTKADKESIKFVARKLLGETGSRAAGMSGAEGRRAAGAGAGRERAMGRDRASIGGKSWIARLLFAAALLAPGAAAAQIAVSANDGKQVLVDGVQTVPDAPAPDSVSIIRMARGTARILATIPVPTSVIGPPRSVAVAPDGSFAIVTSARRISDSDPHQIVPDDRVSVVSLTGTPRVVQQVRAGAGASGVSIDRAGKVALVANRAEGSVSMFAIRDGRLTPVATLALDDPAASPAQPLFYAGGTRALVSRDGDNRISVIEIGKDGMRLLPGSIAPGLRPYGIDTAGLRVFGVSANIGGGGRDIDTISLILLTESMPRVIDTVAVGLTPEGIKMSPDGRFVAVDSHNGSGSPRASPTYHRDGVLQIWRILPIGRLRLVAQAPAGSWGQGLAWSSDGKTLLAQSMDRRLIEVFHFDGRRLRRTAVMPMPAGPAAIATAEP